jgi:hypothetical protein
MGPTPPGEQTIILLSLVPKENSQLKICATKRIPTKKCEICTGRKKELPGTGVM